MEPPDKARHEVMSSLLTLLMRRSPFLPVDCFENKQLYFATRLGEAMKVIMFFVLIFLCYFKDSPFQEQM